MAFIQADALDFMQRYGYLFDVIHASPPCQGYSSITKTAGTQDDHKRLIPVTRKLVQQTGKPYVIENVPGAKSELENPLMLCGTMFNLNVIRHRYFEVNPPLYFAPATCAHIKKVVKCGRVPDPEKHYASPVGHFSGVEFAQQSMGIDWLGQDGLRKAIPPAMTEYIGRYLLKPPVLSTKNSALSILIAGAPEKLPLSVCFLIPKLTALIDSLESGPTTEYSERFVPITRLVPALTQQINSPSERESCKSNGESAVTVVPTASDI
jgi:DNA (cytosine-5)-methyltransferase 1